MTEDPFRALFDRAKAGDKEAVSGLIERHFDGLRAFIRLKSGRLVRAMESCSDLVSTVCREALRDLPAVDCADEQAFKQWLYSVAHHKIHRKAAYHRAEKRDAAKRVSLDGDGAGDASGLLAEYMTICTPSREANAREEIERIENAFDQLSEDYRKVITEACFAKRPHKDIALELGKSEAAVRQLLSRARARLALLLRYGG